MKIGGKNNNIYKVNNSSVQKKGNGLKTRLPQDAFVSSSSCTKNGKKSSLKSKICEKLNGILSSFSKQEKAQEQTIIPPRGFSSAVNVNSYMPSSVAGRCIDISYVEKDLHTDARIKPEFNPGTLDIVDDVEDCLYASNFAHPGGTIAIPSTLKETLATSDLNQCNGVAFVDRKHNLQTLLHFAPGVNNADNKALVEYLLSYMKPEDTEIKIVPGCYADTNATVACLTHIIEEVSQDYDIKYMNFPDNEHKTLVLKNGELKCCKESNPKEGHVNPENKIVWARHEVQR